MNLFSKRTEALTLENICQERIRRLGLSPFERRCLRLSIDAELRRVGEGLADAAGMLEEVDELSDLLQEQERALQRDSLVLCGLEREHFSSAGQV